MNITMRRVYVQHMTLNAHINPLHAQYDLSIYLTILWLQEAMRGDKTSRVLDMRPLMILNSNSSTHVLRVIITKQYWADPLDLNMLFPVSRLSGTWSAPKRLKFKSTKCVVAI